MKTPCIIPGCGKPARAKHLCNSHYQKRCAGKSIEQMLEALSAAPGIGSNAPFTVRISSEAIARLTGAAKARGFVNASGKPSAYKLASHVLETWEPDK